MPWIRSGECNWCGECCGSEETADPRSPFNPTWPESIRNWDWNVFREYWKYAELVGMSEDVDGTVTWEHHGERMIPSKGTFYYVWQPGVGFCRDTSPAHDGTSYSVTCPFLLDDDGTGGATPHRECAIATSNQLHDQWLEWCGRYPFEQVDDDYVTQWFESFPSCSYTYTYVED
jgi:hypothetical protein